MITQKELKKQLHYSPTTGLFRWIGINKYHSEKQNKIAGCNLKSRNKLYTKIGVNGKRYKAHQLAFLYMLGFIPKEIDHINGIGIDNRWSNLTACSKNQNSQNHTKTINGSGLPCGVRTQKSGNYLARITVDKKLYSLGSYKTIEEASLAYETAKKKFHYCPARAYL